MLHSRWLSILRSSPMCIVHSVRFVVAHRMHRQQMNEDETKRKIKNEKVWKKYYLGCIEREHGMGHCMRCCEQATCLHKKSEKKRNRKTNKRSQRSAHTSAISLWSTETVEHGHAIYSVIYCAVSLYFSSSIFFISPLSLSPSLSVVVVFVESVPLFSSFVALGIFDDVVVVAASAAATFLLMAWHSRDNVENL